MTVRKRLLFALVAMALSVVAVTAVLLAADLYAHHRVERSVGVNWRGYRGPTVGRKQPGELRIVMLGGSTVFGYGVAWDETIAAYLERDLATRSGSRPVRVINLGFIGEGVYAFLPTLRDFESLDFDLACLYEGYNDLAGDARPNTDLFRHESPVFRLTGYLPALPLVLKEKAMALRFGNVEAAYKTKDGAPVFRPGLARQTSAAALEAAAAVSSAMGRQLARLSTQEGPSREQGIAGCAAPWSHYCDAVYAAAEFGASRGRRVLVVAQPRLKNEAADRHAGQQHALDELAGRVLTRNPNVRYVDLSAAVDLSDPEMSFDGMHLNPKGNEVVAGALAGPIAQWNNFAAAQRR
jgi:lysophospholipase L1-like esterase